MNLSTLQRAQLKRGEYTRARTKRHQYLKNIGQYHGPTPTFRTHGTRRRINILDLFKPKAPAPGLPKMSFMARMWRSFKKLFRL